MTDLERRRLVLEVALLTEDRSREEQRALLDFALRLDNEANRLTVTNRRPRDEPAYVYVLAVTGSWRPSKPSRPVTLTATEREGWQKRVNRWDGREEDDPEPGVLLDAVIPPA